MASTNFTNAVTLTDAGWFNEVDTAAYSYLTSVAGTNTITATGPVSMSAYAAGQIFRLIPANTNTGATTLNISSLGAKNIYFNGAALIGGELRANVPVEVMYDGTQFHLLSASNVVLLSASTASSSASLSASLSSSFNEFQFSISGLIPATDNTDLHIQYSTDGGSTWITTASYNWSRTQNTTASATPGGESAAADTKIRIANAIANTASKGLDAYGTIIMGNINAVLYKSAWIVTGGSTYAQSSGAGSALISTPNAIRILMSSGNIASGTLKVWGRK